ncbi:MAG: insulinase family protein [Clostridiales bacterium]|nr:insulinase family protein [Clostridiales bacterium]
MYIKNGVRARLLKSDKFKTNIVGVFFSTELDKENVTKNALIPAVLRRGTNKYPTMRHISIELENLYGAKFDCGVSKKGELQVLRFYGETVNDKYLVDSDNNTLKLAEIIKDIIFNPVLTNGKFNEEYLAQEKIKLKNIIESRKNDKVQYALERCYELMAGDEPYGLCEYGDVEKVDSISNEQLVCAYNNMIKNFNVDIVVAGNIDEKEFDNIINLFDFVERDNTVELKINEVEPGEVKNIIEEFEINQGKLSLAYRTNVKPNTKEYFDMLVYNGILGSGVQSKLFQNVREKYSLAYYAFSRADKFKGVMGISSGIEQQNYQKALDTILEQVEDMKKGNITDYEYNTTIKTIENSLNSMKDEQLSLVDFYYGQELINSDLSLEDVIESMKKVTVEDVVKVAHKVKLDTIYFMKGKE